MAKIIAEISPGPFAWVMGCRAEEQNRFRVAGVFIERQDDESAIMVATDGRIMAVARDLEAKVRRSGIFVPSIELERRLRSRAAWGGRLSIFNDGAYFQPTKGRGRFYEMGEIDGTFPAWRDQFTPIAGVARDEQTALNLELLNKLRIWQYAKK